MLDQMLFGDNLSRGSYGLDPYLTELPRLLKPHGSLNWFQGPRAKLLNREKRFLLHSVQEPIKEEVYAFKPYRSPVSKDRTYMPMIIPPVYGKTFAMPIFRDLWRSSVAALSAARKIVFLGYSLPSADLHAKFILRCGLHNQTDGAIIERSSRTRAPGPANVVIVNPDAESARRIEATVGVPADWEPVTVERWAQR